MKFKLIKEFPLSPEKGTVVEFKTEKDFSDGIYDVGAIPNLMLQDCEKYPEFWERFKTKNELISFLESLIHKRFTIKELEEKLSSFCMEKIYLVNKTQKDIDNGEQGDDICEDYNFMFDLADRNLHGYFDIYMLPTARVYEGEETRNWFITEVGYEFD